jgi:hypothetical protein
MRRMMMAAMAMLSAQGWAATFSPGTYIVEGGSYSITVDQEGDKLIVVEPNKRSEYAPQGDGSFTFYNPNTDATYGLRVIDDHTIEAFKPGQPGNVPTRLVRLGGAPDAGPAPSGDEEEKWSKLADHYSARIGSDPANAQSWVACSAVALRRSTASKAEADAYAHQMAGMLKQLDAASSPCPDVILPENW